MAVATTDPPVDVTRYFSVKVRGALAAVGWMSVAQFVCLAIRLGSSLVLSRLLAPDAYGILSPALAVLVTLEWFCDLGVRPALIRHPEGGTFDFLNTGWWIDCARGGGMGLVILAIAWPLSEFLELPQLAGVLASFTLYPLLLTLRSPGLVNLRRELNYRALVANEIVTTAVGTFVTLAVAWWSPTVWAMVAGMFAGAAAGVVHSYVLCPVGPCFRWNSGVARQVLHGSRNIFLNTLLMAIWLNSERLIGLRLVSVEQMGLYAVALNLAGVLDFMIGRACDVYFSYLSRTADPTERSNCHELLCLRVSLVAMPAIGLMALLAPWTVRLLYDPRYSAAGILLAVMLIRLMLRALGQIQFQNCLARAEIGISTAAYVIALIAQAILLVPFAERWDALGLALAGLVSTVSLTLTQSLLIWRRGQGRLEPILVTFGWVALASVLLILIS